MPLLDVAVKHRRSFRDNLHHFLAHSPYYIGLRTTHVFPSTCCFTIELTPAQFFLYIEEQNLASSTAFQTAKSS
jgi:hypothetical protein